MNFLNTIWEALQLLVRPRMSVQDFCAKVDQHVDIAYSQLESMVVPDTLFEHIAEAYAAGTSPSEAFEGFNGALTDITSAVDTDVLHGLGYTYRWDLARLSEQDFAACYEHLAARYYQVERAIHQRLEDRLVQMADNYNVVQQVQMTRGTGVA